MRPVQPSQLIIAAPGRSRTAQQPCAMQVEAMCGAPSYQAAPVVHHERDSVVPQRLHDAHHIGHHILHGVRCLVLKHGKPTLHQDLQLAEHGKAITRATFRCHTVKSTRRFSEAP